MTREIELQDNKLIFRRKLWNDEDTFLARCLWFTIDPETNEIVCDLKVTLRTAIKAWLEQAFPALMTQPMRREERDSLSKAIGAVYKKFRNEYISEIAPKIPYWDVLKKHQKSILIDTNYRHVTLLGMQQRTGKSITAATISLATNCKRTVIICRSIGKYNYLKDLTSPRWNRNKTVFDPFDYTILDASKRKCMYAWRERFVIVNYESAEKHLDYLIKSGSTQTDHIVIDECQNVKSQYAKRSQVVQELIDACPNARLTLMSGTYLMNRVDDVFNYFVMAKHPLGKSKAEFDRRYLIRETSGKFNRVVGAKDADKLSAHLSNFAIRVLFSDCSDMPRQQHFQLHYQIGDWRDLYQEAVRKAIEDHGKRVSNSWIHSVNNVMAQAKVPGTVDHILQTIDEGSKIVVFTNYTEPLNMLERAMKENNVKYVRVDGAVKDDKEKMRLANQFQETPEIMVFIANTGAAGHTIPLHMANIMVILDQPLTPKVVEQCVSRLENMEKKEGITIYHATCIGEMDEVTVDQKLVELNAGKLIDIDAVVDGGRDINNIQNTSEILFESLIQQYGKPVTQ